MLCWIHEQSTGTNSVWWSSPDPSRIHCKKKSCIKFKRLVYFLFATIEQYFFMFCLEWTWITQVHLEIIISSNPGLITVKILLPLVVSYSIDSWNVCQKFTFCSCLNSFLLNVTKKESKLAKLNFGEKWL